MLAHQQVQDSKRTDSIINQRLFSNNAGLPFVPSENNQKSGCTAAD